ncbi:winged helix-turn-helix domain-containing protein [Enterococcus sp. HY326]|uniref:winged helix-turn-helix domain-containing protein n=1 Tax=Enterococcus sp. HY326 TaxID=2971265 RepID=UPI00223E977C|nr:helix-turn-helix domain-containing protein [Enterococcus sp. HY326]
MQQILLLTKNIFIDSDWQNRIQQLGYEVFCSSQVLEQVLFKQDFSLFSLFKTIIFSESITDEEVSKIVENASTEQTSLFRIDEQPSSEEYMDGVNSRDVLKIINSQMNPNELREALVDGKSIKILATFSQNFQETSVKEVSIQSIGTLLGVLSRKEKELFDILYAKNGDFVARTELSTSLWHQEVSNSSLTQLSQIIGRLKRKMQKFDFDENFIITHWNKGYALDRRFCESIDAFENEKVNN